tara:strand:+ start:138 stop:347 length:210 start_codon:yes stop_codon:yes gene_type:complete
MASNPYELRWEVYSRAEDLLRERYSCEVSAWNEKKEAGIEPGTYPLFPSDDEIYAAAQRMKDWYEFKES